MMDMKLEVIRFSTDDVIATSGVTFTKESKITTSGIYDGIAGNLRVIFGEKQFDNYADFQSAVNGVHGTTGYDVSLYNAGQDLTFNSIYNQKYLDSDNNSYGAGIRNGTFSFYEINGTKIRYTK